MLRKRRVAKARITVPYFSMIRARNGMRNSHCPTKKNPKAMKRIVVAKKTLVTITLLLKSLVLAEVRDRKTQRVHGNHGIGDAIFDHENEMGCICLPLQGRSIAIVVIDLFEIDNGLIRRGSQVFNGDVF